MPQTIDINAIRKLSHEQRWALINQIWDTMADEDGDIRLSEETMSEMRRRVDEMKRAPSNSLSHAEVKQFLRSRSRG